MVVVTAAVVNEVLERRQRQRWSLLAQYAMFEFVHAARLVWGGLLELTGLAPDGEVGDAALVPVPRRGYPRLGVAIHELLASAESRESCTDRSPRSSAMARRSRTLGGRDGQPGATRKSSTATWSSTAVSTGGAACLDESAF